VQIWGDLVKRQLGWGLVAAVLGALVVPLADGALAIATPSAVTAPETSAVSLVQPPPPPPTSKIDPVDRTPIVKVPGSMIEHTIVGTDRQAVQASSSGCAAAPVGTTNGAPGITSPKGVKGTTSADMQSFAIAYNAKRVAHCLRPVPLANFRYDSCMERRLFWMAEDPSTNPASAWGHIGTQRSDGVPSVGCDGNLAGGMNNTGSTVAAKWWDSSPHRTALYKPTYKSSTAGVCIYYAVTHGGVPNEPEAFTRAAARWGSC
jgi:hypothetical protein